MKKMNYLLSVLLISFLFPFTGLFSSDVNEVPANQQAVVTQNQPVLPDYASNKQVLDELKTVREMIMRSDNRVYRAKALRQMNDQMNQILFEKEKLNSDKLIVVKEKKSKVKSSEKYFSDNNVLLNVNKTENQQNGSVRKKVPFDGVMKYRLDSIVFSEKDGDEWFLESKQEFTYNYNARVTSSSAYSYGETGKWDNDERSLITYNDAGQMTMYLWQRWDDHLERWIDDFKMLIEYNNNGDVLKEEAYSEQFDEQAGAYVVSGQWKNEYGFDTNNKEISSIFYSWDYELAEWIPDSKNEYNFENGMELMFAGYQWSREKNKWIGHWKFEYAIVQGIHMLNSIFYHWDYEKDEWYIQEKTEYVLSSDESGTVITETRWSTHDETGNLIFESRTIYTKPFGQIGEDLSASFRSIINYQWDMQNGDWIYRLKTDNTFDSFGNITQRFDSIWVFTGDANEWIIDFSIEANVNASGKISDYVLSNWYFNGLTNYMYEKFQYLNTYNDKLELITQIQQGWDFDGQVWKNISKVEYSFDEAGRVISQIWYALYNPDTMQWTPNRKTESAYNLDGTEALYANYEWNVPMQEWKLTFKYENYIDAYGVAVLESSIQWNSFLNMEIINYRREKTFDENRNLTMTSSIQTTMYWDGSQYFVVIEGEKTENAYDLSGRLISTIEYEHAQDTFVPEDKFEYTYHATHPAALESEIYFEWDVLSSDWKATRKGELTSNFDVTRSDLILPFGGEEESDSRELRLYFNYMATQLNQYKWSDAVSDWVDDFKVQVYYTQSEFSSVEEIKPGVVTVYPNPVSDFISVRFSETSTASFRIYDLQGRKLFDAPVNNHSKIDVSGFANGVYFYQITMGQETVSGKLLKK